MFKTHKAMENLKKEIFLFDRDGKSNINGLTIKDAFIQRGASSDYMIIGFIDGSWGILEIKTILNSRPFDLGNFKRYLSSDNSLNHMVAVGMLTESDKAELEKEAKIRQLKEVKDRLASTYQEIERLKGRLSEIHF